MQEEDSQYMPRILAMFKSHQCHEETLLTKQQLSKILNQQAQRKLNRNFNSVIIREIWGQAQTNSRGQSTMRTFAKILNNAIDILQSRLYRINSPQVGIPHYQRELQQINDKLSYLQSQYQAGFLQNYEKINVERKNKVIIENKIRQIRQQQINFKKQLQEIKACIYPMPSRQPPTIRQTKIQHSQVLRPYPEPQISHSFDRSPNPTLLHIFQLCVVSIVLQLLILTIRQSFLTLICLVLIVFWLFLGYYDKMFVTYLLIGLGLSILLDLIYLLLQFTGIVNTINPTGSGLIVVIVIFLVVSVGLRVLMIIFMLPFKNPSNKDQYFKILGQQIELKQRAGKRNSINY